jgi:hypothetical protein
MEWSRTAGRVGVIAGGWLDVLISGQRRFKLRLKSRGFMAWLWLVRTIGQAKAAKKPSLWLGLAGPIWARLGLAHGLRPGQAQHYT